MMKKSYIIFFSFFLTTIHAMEKEIKVAKEKTKALLSRKQSKKSISSSAITEHKEIYTEHALITSARNKNHAVITFHLSNRYFNPNVQNLELNTPFHYAAENQDNVAIQLFLNDHRIDASIKNINNKTARDLIDIANVRDLMEKTKADNTENHKNLVIFHGELTELRRTMFARATLDIITTQECATIRPTYQNGLITAGLINETIQKIKAKIRAIEEKQITQHNSEDCGDLPPSALLPKYATDNFMKDMIFFRLSLDAINSAWLK